MKAIVKFAEGYGNLEIRDIPKPEIKEHEILIEIKAAGICGTDLHHYEVGNHIAIPVVLGHEFSSDVVEIGKEVKMEAGGSDRFGDPCLHLQRLPFL
jgi:L-iditol 2-dehydrogenase